MRVGNLVIVLGSFLRGNIEVCLAQICETRDVETALSTCQAERDSLERALDEGQIHQDAEIEAKIEEQQAQNRAWRAASREVQRAASDYTNMRAQKTATARAQSEAAYEKYQDTVAQNLTNAVAAAEAIQDVEKEENKITTSTTTTTTPAGPSMNIQSDLGGFGFLAVHSGNLATSSCAELCYSNKKSDPSCDCGRDSDSTMYNSMISAGASQIDALRCMTTRKNIEREIRVCDIRKTALTNQIEADQANHSARMQKRNDSMILEKANIEKLKEKKRDLYNKLNFDS